MRIVKLKTSQSRHTGGGRGSGGDSPTAPPSQHQQQSYLQRMCSQFASLRVSYVPRHSTKEKDSTKDTLKNDRDATRHDELGSIEEDVVYRLGSKDSDFHTPSHQQQPQHNVAGEDDKTCEPDRAKKELQPPTRHLLSWGEAKSRIHQTTTMLRDACATKSSALLSTAWRVYPGSKQSARHRSSSSSSPSSGADTPPPKRSAKEQQCEQWLLTAGRESEISICMSYYSSRSLSDAATDSEDQQQLQLQFLQTATWRRCTSSGDSSSSSSRAPSENERDPFRRRCSSADSYVSNERGSRGGGGPSVQGGTCDEDGDDADFGEETIRESLFVRDGKPYAIRNEWF